MELRDYQKHISEQAAELLKTFGLCYLAMECRTGKTLTALACAQEYGAKAVLIVSKLKALPSIKADYALLQPSYTLEVINYESAHKCTGEYDLVILDEAHSLGAYPKPSQRTKAIKEICKGLPILFLSGTPSPESFSQLYHQFWVSTYTPFYAYRNFYAWAKTFVAIKQRMVNGHMLNDYSRARKELIDRACKHLFIDYTQQQAGFCANIEEHVITTPMGVWTRQALRTLLRDRVLELKDGVVIGDTPAKLLTKLHQLSSGTLIDEDGNHLITDRNKAEYIARYFRGKKIALFYVYQTEAELLKSVFDKWTSSPEEFQTYNGTDMVFLGQVRSAREGVRLDTADALVFFNLEYSYLSYEQGKNRLSSKERTSPAKVYFSVSDCGIEKKILEAVRSKCDFTYQYYKAKMGL